jgi:hypothetical protein
MSGSYALFLTDLDADGFLARSCAFISIMDVGPSKRCSPMKMLKSILIAGVPTRSVGKNCGKLPESAVWNLRLSLGQTMQEAELREIEWAPPKEAPPYLVAEENPPEEYGPWQWAAAFGRATGRIASRCFHITGGWEAPLSSRGQPVVERSARVRMPLRKPGRLPGVPN